MEHYGIISLLPAITVVTLALLTRRTLEPLLLGAIVGFFIIGGPTDFFPVYHRCRIYCYDGCRNGLGHPGLHAFRQSYCLT